MDVVGNSPVKQVQIEAVIIRADGSREDLGVIADSAWKWYKPWTWSDKKAANERIYKANKKVVD